MSRADKSPCTTIDTENNISRITLVLVPHEKQSMAHSERGCVNKPDKRCCASTWVLVRFFLTPLLHTNVRPYCRRRPTSALKHVGTPDRRRGFLLRKHTKPGKPRMAGRNQSAGKNRFAFGKPPFACPILFAGTTKNLQLGECDTDTPLPRHVRSGWLEKQGKERLADMDGSPAGPRSTTRSR